MRIRKSLIIERAQRLLADGGVKGAPVPVRDLTRFLGLELRSVPADESDDVSGFLLHDPQKESTVIGVNSRHHLNRQRFTIAHEIGHYLLHPHDHLYVDTQFRAVFRDGRSSEGTDVREMEANRFAAELLMPREFLQRDFHGQLDLESDDIVRKLAKKYQVSELAMSFRLQDVFDYAG